MNEEDLREIIIQTLGVNPGVLFNIWETWQNRHTAYRCSTIALVQVCTESYQVVLFLRLRQTFQTRLGYHSPVYVINKFSAGYLDFNTFKSSKILHIYADTSFKLYFLL